MLCHLWGEIRLTIETGMKNKATKQNKSKKKVSGSMLMSLKLTLSLILVNYIQTRPSFKNDQSCEMSMKGQYQLKKIDCFRSGYGWSLFWWAFFLWRFCTKGIKKSRGEISNIESTSVFILLDSSGVMRQCRTYLWMFKI